MSEMIERTSFDTPILPRLSTIIAELQRGIYQIPEFQRPSVWDDDQRLRLMDSIVKGLPIGSILVWRSSGAPLTTYPTVAGIPVPTTPHNDDKRTYLIDGHQRVSSLFGALVKPPKPREGPDAKRWPIYYVLGTSESPAFKLPPRQGEAPSHWLPLNILLDDKALYRFKDALFRAGEDEKAEEVERIANVFKDCIIPVVPLVTNNLDLVTDAFVRINSQGSDMTEAHMLRALTYLKPDRDTDKGFERIRAALRPKGWGDIPDQALVNSLKAALGLDVYRSSVTELNGRLKESENRGALEKLLEALVEAVEALSAFGVPSWGALPYAYQLVTLAALAYREPGSLARRQPALHAWFWRTTYAEYFTGQTGGQIRRDIEELAGVWTLLGANTIAYDQEVRPVQWRLRQGTVRAKALLLFLANCPTNSDAKERRQAVLSALLQGGRALPLLFPRSGAVPGNVVIAERMELRALRKAIKAGRLSPEIADEFYIPAGAGPAEDLLTARTQALSEAETSFVQSLGLTVRTDAEVHVDEEWDDAPNLFSDDDL